MQIDILSQNTLKLTLSKLDMFDLDIKYDSLSGKNPETKRLLAHVLKSIQLDKRVGFDFSGERLFVEAFPRPDGGCMLYISCLENDAASKRSKKSKSSFQTSRPDSQNMSSSLASIDRLMDPPSEYDVRPFFKEVKPRTAERTSPQFCVCEVKGLDPLRQLAGSLFRLKKAKKLAFSSDLYHLDGTYRLVVGTEEDKQVRLIANEYGAVVGDRYELMRTEERFALITAGKAVEQLSRALKL